MSRTHSFNYFILQAFPSQGLGQGIQIGKFVLPWKGKLVSFFAAFQDLVISGYFTCIQGAGGREGTLAYKQSVASKLHAP